METVLDVSWHEYDASRLNWPIFVADVDHPVSAGDIVDLIFRVRLLWIQFARAKFVHAEAHLRDSQKFQIGFAQTKTIFFHLVELKDLH